MWSSNGDINAGKGAKTNSETPQPSYVCDPDGFCRVDPRGQVSGAGIGSLQTIPDAPTGDVFLIAPRGTVDAGDAGIRVSGDLFVAALAVANADNIQVQGKSVGLPPQPVTNLTLTTASTAATEAAQISNSMKAQQPQTSINVEVTGFGGDINQPDECLSNSVRPCK
jgi:filamentous hemagglutinin-like outer membrane protein